MRPLMPAYSAHLFPNAGYIEKDRRAHGSPRPQGPLPDSSLFQHCPANFILLSNQQA
jgi:hypothetical protein